MIPSGWRGGVNTYTYVRGDPVKLTDPRGLSPEYCGQCAPGDFNCLLYGGNLCNPGNDPAKCTTLNFSCFAACDGGTEDLKCSPDDEVKAAGGDLRAKAACGRTLIDAFRQMYCVAKCTERKACCSK